VLVPTKEFVAKLQAARLAADVCDVPTILIARTDALGAFLLTSDVDEYDRPFCTGGRLRSPRVGIAPLHTVGHTFAGGLRVCKIIVARLARQRAPFLSSRRCPGGAPRLSNTQRASQSPGLPFRFDDTTAGERTSEGFYCIKGGIDAAIARGLAYAPYADLLWFEVRASA
jgi:isocitrate lyase